MGIILPRQICINPNMSFSRSLAPVFVAPPTVGESTSARGPSPSSSSKKLPRQQLKDSELFQMFDEFGLDVMYEDSSAVPADGPYDICPPEYRAVTAPRKLALAQR